VSWDLSAGLCEIKDISNLKVACDCLESRGLEYQAIENIEKIVKRKGVNGAFGVRRFCGNFSHEALYPENIREDFYVSIRCVKGGPK